uniref:GRF-type domain-containing protein n=1 Tax=Arachis hypogaea TaxID=3818 RepID=G0Y6T8_ARAHY|nr:unknown [Arachis hypogaea]
MASDGVSSSSRRSGGGRREDQFAASSVPNGKDGKDDVSPKCLCGENVIMFMLKMRSNPNRLFLGCPFYKVRQPYCRIFLWFDEHIARIGMTETRYLGEKKIGDVEEHHGKTGHGNQDHMLREEDNSFRDEKNPIG